MDLKDMEEKTIIIVTKPKNTAGIDLDFLR